MRLSATINIVLAASLLLTTGSLVAQTQPTSPTPPPNMAAPAAPPLPVIADPTPSARDTAMKIAMILQSENINLRQIDRAYTTSVPAAYRANPNVAAMEQRWPGIIDAAIAVERKHGTDHVLKRLPAIQQAYAQMLSAYLTEPELRRVLAMYESPVGKKALDAAADGGDYSNVTRINAAGGQADATDIMTAQASSAGAFVSILSAQEIRELMAYAASSTGRKMMQLQPYLVQRMLEVSRPNEQERAAINEAVMMATRDYIQNYKKPTAKAP